MNSEFSASMPSPLGQLILTGKVNKQDQFGLTGIYFPDHRDYVKIQTLPNHDSAFMETIKQLTEYFEGTRKNFNIPLSLEGTEFRKKVWAQLINIPFGETQSYLDISVKINNPKASRAVGTANGANPIAIIIPCHRVIAQSGALTGYAGGIEAKQWLLNHEQTHKEK